MTNIYEIAILYFKIQLFENYGMISTLKKAPGRVLTKEKFTQIIIYIK